ncbi:hypothetical protein BGY98DRAFT_467130 [Russula aff. rugulosa BPL654]|nr:hypothetical protein BGY98DRAFT_467130 [Russula aff. rugulosa BPL654]
MHDSAELFSRTVPITPRHHTPPHGTHQRTLCSFLPYLRVSHPLDPPPTLFRQKNPMSYPSIRYRRRHRRPIDSQHGLAKLEHKSRLCNPRGKARAAWSARRVARGSGNAETMTASSSPAPSFRMSLPRCPCQALRPCPHAIHLPEVAAKCPSTAPIPVSPTAFIASDL